MNTSCTGGVNQALHQLHRTGGRVDHRGASTYMGKNTVFTQHDLADLRGAGQRGHHHIGLRHGLSYGLGLFGTQSHQIGCFVRDRIQHRDVIACANQIRSHGVAHVANADKGQSWQWVHDFVKVKNCGLSLE